MPHCKTHGPGWQGYGAVANHRPVVGEGAGWEFYGYQSYGHGGTLGGWEGSALGISGV